LWNISATISSSFFMRSPCPSRIPFLPSGTGAAALFIASSSKDFVEKGRRGASKARRGDTKRRGDKRMQALIVAVKGLSLAPTKGCSELRATRWEKMTAYEGVSKRDFKNKGGNKQA
jgi:hypothetical protein